ncbi:putative RNA-directed DNA polymerase [Helianthus annuus]|nr:putative RNA-directed DNA polymerase [Helianthus annuus]
MLKEFEMSDMGLLKFFLGLEVTQTVNGVFLSQQQYAKNLLSKFGMKNCNPDVLPMNPNEKLQADDGADKADETLYRSLVGGLLYLTHTRPDIMFSVSLVSCFMQSPSKIHFGAARRILRYLSGTVNHGLWYARNKNVELCGFSDSDWAGSIEDRKSVSGSVFSLGSAMVSWSSKKQVSVALSSTEAEYIAAASATCQLVWLRRILKDLGLTQNGASEAGIL